MIELLVICKGLMIGFDQCFRAIDVKFDPKVVVKLILDGCNVRHPYYMVVQHMCGAVGLSLCLIFFIKLTKTTSAFAKYRLYMSNLDLSFDIIHVFSSP
jgi:hypothetical protein